MHGEQCNPAQSLADIVRELDAWCQRRLGTIYVAPHVGNGWGVHLSFTWYTKSESWETVPPDASLLYPRAFDLPLDLPTTDTEAALAVQTRALQDTGLVGQLRLQRLQPSSMGSGSAGPTGPVGPSWRITTHNGSRAERRVWLASLGVDLRTRPDA